MKVIEKLRSPEGTDHAITPGRAYELANAAQPTEPGQVIRFIDKAADGSVAMDGTTNDEVLTMMIDRLSRLQGEQHSQENAMALGHLIQAKTWFELRAIKQAGQGRLAVAAASVAAKPEPAAVQPPPPTATMETPARPAPPPPTRMVKPNLGGKRQAQAAGAAQ